MTVNDGAAPLLDIRDLQVAFRVQGKSVPAVRGASLTVFPGQTVAIVGESGSGKSTTAAAVLGLLPGTGTVTGGQILFDGQDLAAASRRDFEKIRGSGVGLVPQDPNTNLNPVWRVGFQIRETLQANGAAKRGDARKRAIALLREAGMRDPDKRVNQFPHEYSGGMRQRALIAIGLACRPKLLIADEPTSALDVTVQRQILDHLEELTTELGTAVLLITHDLGLAAERAGHLVVMYKGRVVESGPTLQILQDPHHEYTKRLVRAAPSLASRRADGELIGDQALQLKVTEPAQEASSGPEDVVVAANLVKDFPIRGAVPFRGGSTFRAVNDVSFTLRRGTTTAVVGESGSGKSTVARMVLGLLEATSGTVHFDGKDVTSLRGAAAKSPGVVGIRGRG
jgi:peptide/nickel transport system ATP-binding protein